MFASTMRSSLMGCSNVNSSSVVSVAPRKVLTIEAAHKKGAGSTKNGRDSEAKRRGIKVFGGQPVKAGGIIFRQTGSTWYPGDNVGQGRDYTIFSEIDGIVIFQKKPDRNKVHVYPMEHEKAVAAIKATHTKEPGPNGSRKERRRAQYTSRKQTEPVASVAAVVVGTKQP